MKKGGDIMRMAENPFTLTFGKEPLEYINRYDNMDEVIRTFDARNPISHAYMIEGIRGSGKTVLMTSIANQLKTNKDWIVIDLNAISDLIQDFAYRLHDECKQIPDIFQRGFNISAFGVGIGINGSTPPLDYVSMLENMLKETEKAGKKILITIDEVMPNENMKKFASQFQIFIRRGYSIFLLMTGLYENINSIQNLPELTFLLRTPKISLGPLSLLQIQKQYKKIFNIEEEQAIRMASDTRGYAFAFQALGLLYFDHHEDMDYTEILSKLEDLLDDFVYAKIWSNLTGKEKEIVRIMGNNEIQTQVICKKLNMNASNFSKHRDNLLKKGVIISTTRGYVQLALPRFSEVCKSYTIN